MDDDNLSLEVVDKLLLEAENRLSRSELTLVPTAVNCDKIREIEHDAKEQRLSKRPLQPKLKIKTPRKREKVQRIRKKAFARTAHEIRCSSVQI